MDDCWNDVNQTFHNSKIELHNGAITKVVNLTNLRITSIVKPEERFFFILCDEKNRDHDAS